MKKMLAVAFLLSCAAVTFAGPTLPAQTNSPMALALMPDGGGPPPTGMPQGPVKPPSVALALMPDGGGPPPTGMPQGPVKPPSAA